MTTMGLFGSDAGKKKKLDLYSNYLRSEGYVPEVDKDGDLVFKVEGGTYVLFTHEDDPEYFFILFPSFWPIESEKERSEAYVAANLATAKTKVAKVYVLGDNVSASVELLFGDPEQFKPIFRRALSMLRGAVGMFAEKMKESM
jgi:hypothetical protein